MNYFFIFCFKLNSFLLFFLVYMQKIIVRYVCCVLAVIPKNPLFLKTGLLKLNDIFDLQVCKQMLSNFTWYDVDHSSFTPVYSVHSHDTRFSLKTLHSRWLGDHLPWKPGIWYFLKKPGISRNFDKMCDYPWICNFYRKIIVFLTFF